MAVIAAENIHSTRPTDRGQSRIRNRGNEGVYPPGGVRGRGVQAQTPGTHTRAGAGAVANLSPGVRGTAGNTANPSRSDGQGSERISRRREAPRESIPKEAGQPRGAPTATKRSAEVGTNVQIEAGRSSEAKDAQSVGEQRLTPEQQRTVRKLQQRAQKVRAHEQAHVAAAGGYAEGGASYSYTRGPDGKRYPVDGQVNIDTSKARTPEATLEKMRQVRAAALAPAKPSSADLRIAQKAMRHMMEARAELAGQPSHGSSAGVQDGSNVQADIEQKPDPEKELRKSGLSSERSRVLGRVPRLEEGSEKDNVQHSNVASQRAQNLTGNNDVTGVKGKEPGMVEKSARQESGFPFQPNQVNRRGLHVNAAA